MAFASDASNLVPGDTNRWTEVFVHDQQTGTTERVSVQRVTTGWTRAATTVTVSFTNGWDLASTISPPALPPDAGGDVAAARAHREHGVAPVMIPGQGVAGAEE